MSPEFDPKKNAANIAKHGVSLATGDGVLHDPLAITIEGFVRAGRTTLDYRRRELSVVIDGCSLD
jgi:uncharacterized DUF497 family protein